MFACASCTYQQDLPSCAFFPIYEKLFQTCHILKANYLYSLMQKMSALCGIVPYCVEYYSTQYGTIPHSAVSMPDMKLISTHHQCADGFYPQSWQIGISTFDIDVQM